MKNTVSLSLIRQNVDQIVDWCWSCLISSHVGNCHKDISRDPPTGFFLDSRQLGSLACSGPGSSLHLPFYSNNRCLAPTDVWHHTFLSSQDHKMLSGPVPGSLWNFLSSIRDGLNPSDLSSGFDLGSKFQGKTKCAPLISNFSPLLVTPTEIIAFYYVPLE